MNGINEYDIQKNADGLLVLKKYSGEEECIEIPDEVDEIGDRAFAQNTYVKSVYIHSGVKTVGAQAFSTCIHLETVRFENDLSKLEKIDYRAFGNCFNLEEIVLPETQFVLGEKAFTGCNKLKTSDGCIIAGNTLAECTSYDKKIVITHNITHIGESAFKNCVNAIEITIPDGVKIIGGEAFSLWNLQTVELPDTVEVIQERAFEGCRALKYLRIPNVKYVGKRAFAGCSRIEEISGLDTVEYIGEGAFESCTSLKIVKLPDTLKVLGCRNENESGWYGVSPTGVFSASGIESISIPHSLSEIGTNMFRSSNLKNVVIPGNIKEIGKNAFESCKVLKTVVIKEGVEVIKQGAFRDCYCLECVKLPDSITLVEDGAFEECPLYGNMRIPYSIIQNGVDEFYTRMGVSVKGCIVLDGKLERVDAISETIEVPDGTKVIGERVFNYRNNTRIKKVILPDSIERIEENDFNQIEIVLPHGYIRQTKKLPTESTIDLLRNRWRVIDSDTGERGLKLTVEDYAQLYLLQNNKTIDSICFPYLNMKPNEALLAFNSVLSNRRSQTYYKKVTDFILLDVKRFDKEVLEQFCDLAKKNKEDSFAESIMDSLPDSIDIRKNTPEGEVPYTVAMCALVPYMQQLKEKPKHISGYEKSATSFSFNNAADRIASSFDRESFETMLDDLIGPGRPAALEKLVPYGRFASGKQISALISRFKDWGDWYLHGVQGRMAIIVANGAILLNDSKEAIMYANKKGLINQYARMRNADVDSILDNCLADFGLDESGKKTFDLGNTTIEASVNKDLQFVLYDKAADKIVKSIPKRGADETKYELAKAEFADMKKNLKAVVKDRNKNLFKDFLSGHKRGALSWKASYLNNYILHKVAELVVWRQKKQTFILTEDGAVDCEGNEYEILDNYSIKVAHPIDMSPEEITAWQKYLTSHQLKQPFEQVWEPVFDIDKFEPDRYKGCMIPYYRFLHKEDEGITINDYDFHNEIVINIDGFHTDIARIDWGRHEISVNDRFEITNIRPYSISRSVNHIIAYFDRITVMGRVLNDDVTVKDYLPRFTAAQISEFIEQANENHCNNVLAVLMDYKNTEYEELDPMDEFTLD